MDFAVSQALLAPAPTFSNVPTTLPRGRRPGWILRRHRAYLRAGLAAPEPIALGKASWRDTCGPKGQQVWCWDRRGRIGLPSLDNTPTQGVSVSTRFRVAGYKAPSLTVVQGPEPALVCL